MLITESEPGLQKCEETDWDAQGVGADLILLVVIFMISNKFFKLNSTMICQIMETGSNTKTQSKTTKNACRATENT